MADTTFTAKITKILATWLQDVNDLVYRGIGTGGVSTPFLQAGTGAVASTVQAKLRKSLSFDDFGAIGDGIADDAAAIALTITAGGATDAVIEGTQGKIYLIGTAGINLTNKTNIHLRGNGSILKAGGVSALTDILGHNVAVLFDTCTRCSISGFEFDGNGLAADAVSFKSCTDCVAEHNTIHDAGDNPGAAITSYNSTRSAIRDNDLYSCAFAGIWSGNYNNGQMDTDVEIIRNKVRSMALSDGIIVASVGGRVADNYVTGCGASGVIFGGGNGFSSKRLAISGNVCVVNAFHGIQFDVTYSSVADLPLSVAISGNVCASNINSGILAVYGSLASITGNTCQDNGVDGITVDELDNFSITGNVCRDTRAGGARTQDTGINLVAQINTSGIKSGVVSGNLCSNHTAHGMLLSCVGATDSIDNVAIVSNTCVDNGATGIIVTEAAVGIINKLSVVGNVCHNNTTSDLRVDPLNVSIFGNLFSTITGATGSFNFTDLDATPSVKGSRKFFRCANTGATVITMFDDGFAGQEIVVWFTNANTTVTDGGNILLAGAANFVSSSDDTLSLIFDGTAWHETARSVN